MKVVTFLSQKHPITTKIDNSKLNYNKFFPTFGTFSLILNFKKQYEI